MEQAVCLFDEDIVPGIPVLELEEPFVFAHEHKLIGIDGAGANEGMQVGIGGKTGVFEEGLQLLEVAIDLFLGVHLISFPFLGEK